MTEKNIRHHLHRTLQIIEQIQTKYPQVPKADTLTEEQIAWIEGCIQRFRENIEPLNLSCRKVICEIRNKITHKKNVLKNEKIDQLFSTFFNELPLAKAEVKSEILNRTSKNKPKRQFEKFSSAFSGELERKQFVDALESVFINGSTQTEAGFPKEQLLFPASQLSNAVEKISNPDEPEYKELFDYAKTVDVLKENIQEEILNWTDTASASLASQNPFFYETQFADQLQSMAIDEQSFSKIQWHYKRLLTVSDSTRGEIGKPNINFDFYTKEFDKKNNSPEILSRNFTNDILSELSRRKIEWEMNQIDKMRHNFLKELYEKIKKYKKLTETLKKFSYIFGYLWDLSLTDFNDYGLEILESFADLLSKDDELQKLADLIGRHVQDDEKIRKEKRENTKIVTENIFRTAFKGQITGLKLGNELSDVLKTELALYRNPATKTVFMLKFAQKQLLSYAYQNEVQNSRTEKIEEEIDVSEKEKKGPILVCVDTSGSMSGAPERIAKTITFALVKKALDEDRSCYLISFSANIETMDLTNIKQGDGLKLLTQFLRMSFNGGTDATPALNHALELIESEEWNKADVLVVSDMIMGEPHEDTVTMLKTAQENNTKFYSLIIGNSANPDVPKLFNKNWLYDTNSSEAGKKLIKQLEEI